MYRFDNETPSSNNNIHQRLLLSLCKTLLRVYWPRQNHHGPGIPGVLLLIYWNQKRSVRKQITGDIRGMCEMCFIVDWTQFMTIWKQRQWPFSDLHCRKELNITD